MHIQKQNLGKVKAFICDWRWFHCLNVSGNFASETQFLTWMLFLWRVRKKISGFKKSFDISYIFQEFCSFSIIFAISIITCNNTAHPKSEPHSNKFELVSHISAGIPKTRHDFQLWFELICAIMFDYSPFRHSTRLSKTSSNDTFSNATSKDRYKKENVYSSIRYVLYLRCAKDFRMSIACRQGWWWMIL